MKFSGLAVDVESCGIKTLHFLKNSEFPPESYADPSCEGCYSKGSLLLGL